MNQQCSSQHTTYYTRDIMFVSSLEIVAPPINHMPSHILLPCSLLCDSSDLI